MTTEASLSPAEAVRPPLRLGRRHRDAVEAVTGRAVHAVSACRRIETGRSLVIDVVESPARLDDGLHPTFETEREAVGAVVAFRRTGRCNPAKTTG